MYLAEPRPRLTPNVISHFYIDHRDKSDKDKKLRLFLSLSTLRSLSWFKLHLRIHTVPQTKHNTKSLQSRLQWSSGYRACHWTQGSWIQTQPETMDF
jgi:hypothetical protein